MIEVIDAAGQEDSWHLTIDRQTTMAELASLIIGIGNPVTVQFEDHGATLRPVHPGTPPPTAAQLRDILEHGAGRLPEMRLLWRVQ